MDKLQVCKDDKNKVARMPLFLSSFADLELVHNRPHGRSSIPSARDSAVEAGKGLNSDARQPGSRPRSRDDCRQPPALRHFEDGRLI